MAICLSGLPIVVRVVEDGWLFALDDGRIADGSHGDAFALVHVSTQGSCPFMVHESSAIPLYAGVLICLALSLSFYALGRVWGR